MKPVLLILLVTTPVATLSADDARTSATQEERAIRSSVTSYVEAFNRGDAAAIASHWSESGRYLSPTGERLQGREAIKTAFSKSFAESPGMRLQVIQPTVRLLTSDVAVEEGNARIVRAGEVPETVSYLAVHVKRGGAWKLDSVRETALPGPPSPHEQLKQLQWLIGSWVDRAEDSTIETSCAWTKNGNFITRSFKLFTAGAVELEGTQVIGWDPATKQIRSWVFDSEGGFGEGRWTRKDQSWTIRTTHLFPDGAKGSAERVLTRVDGNTFTWRSVNRKIDGVAQPDIEPVTVVRSEE